MSVVTATPLFAQASGSGGGGGSHGWVKPTEGGAGATAASSAYGGGGGGGGGRNHTSADQSTGGTGGGNGSHFDGGGGGASGVVGFDGRTSTLPFNAGSWIGTDGGAGGIGITAPDNTQNPLANGVDGSSGGGGGGGAAGAVLPGAASTYVTGVGVTIKGGNGGQGGDGGSGGSTASVSFSGGAAGGGGGGGGGAVGILLQGGSLEISANTTVSGGNGGRGGDGGTGAVGGPGGITQVCNDNGCHVVGLPGGDGGHGGGAGSGGGGGAGLDAAASTRVVIDTNAVITGGNGGDGGRGGATGYNPDDDYVAAKSGDGGNGGNGGAGIRLGAGATLQIAAGAIVTGGNAGKGGDSDTYGLAGATPGRTGQDGQAGVGIYSAANANIILAGTVRGGLNVDNSRANAIVFAGDNNRLELWAGAVVTGNIATSGSSNTLALGGSANGAFDLSSLDGQYQGFNFFEKVGSSIWSITGSSTRTLDSVRVDGGALTLSANSTLTSTQAVIGGAAGSNGTVTIDGGHWNNWRPIIVGDQGMGSLTISNGGTLVGMVDLVPVFGSLIGNAAGSSGTVVITGAGSAWINYSALGIGVKGTGSLTISDGGRLDTYAEVAIGGAQPGASGSVTVTGAGSVWNTHLLPENNPANALGVGGPGGGGLTISNGGRIESGATSFANATVLVTGAGSVLNTSNFEDLPSLTLHSDASLASTVLTIADGAVVNTGGNPTVIEGAGSSLNIGAAAGDAAVAPGSLVTSAIRFSDGGVLNFNHTASDYVFGAAMSGQGTLDFLAGTTVLTGNSSGFSGATTISGSTLKMSNNASLGGALAIDNGGTLTGYGTVGATTVNGGGVVAPAGGLPLTISGNLIVNGGGTIVSNSSALNVAGNMLLGSGSALDYTIAASAIRVGGNLSLDGATLNIADNGTLPFGTYRVITYSGELTGDALSIGTTASTSPLAYVYTIDTSTAHAVNLVAIPNGIDIFQTWGGGLDGTGKGSGTWNAANANWLDPIGGFTPTSWGSGYGTFDGAGGTVTIEGQQSAVGLEFTNGSYTLASAAGGSLLLHRYDNAGFSIAVPELRVLADITAQVSATIEGVDGLRKSGDGTLILSGANTYSGGTFISGGTLQISSDANLGDASGGLTFETAGATLRTTQTMSTGRTVSLAESAIFDTAAGTTLSASGAITGDGALIKSGEGTLALSGTNGWLGGTLLLAGTLRSDAAGALPSNTDYAIIGGTLDLNGINLTMRSLWGIGGTIALGAAQLTVDQASDSLFAGTISGTGGLVKDGAGTLVLSGSNTYRGGTAIGGGILAITSDANLGDAGGAVALSGGTLMTIGNFTTDRSIGIVGSGAINTWAGTTLTVANGISGSGSFTKEGGGTLVLAGNSSFSGTTDVNNGTLMVTGSLASSSLTSVNAGAWLSGTGVVGTTAINGGVLAPGNPVGLLTVQGSLTMTAASTYAMQVSLANDLVHVTGTADLGNAAVNATFLKGGFVSRSYTILTADAGLGGTVFGSSSVTGLSGNITSHLSYDANNVYLQLAMETPTGLNVNQGNVSNTLVNVFNSGGLPAAFAGLSPAGLTQVSGELATGAQQTSINAAAQFLNMMGDPSLAGRGGAPGVPVAAASGYAQVARTNVSARDAFASLDRKSAPSTRAAPATFDQRWSVWASGFGGSQTTSGNAVVGSGTATSSIFGAVVGADYQISPDTRIGFATMGGGTSFRVADATGSGRSDLFQLGGFVRHAIGPSYVSAALSYGWQDVVTDRSLALVDADRLRADFNAHTFSGRLEGGYRIATPWIGITPYAAGQVVHFMLPSYAEQAAVGSGTFALSYDAKSATVTRTEIGGRADRAFALDGSILTLRGRAAWAHDFSSDRSIAATFQTLPGASFVVNGAAPARDAALANASAELLWLNGVSIMAAFDGEFSRTTTSYAGRGVLRYQW
ncbi:autotransporter domain-containing protein [Bradyrhizobium sp.]|uniref:autotransporter domain-containing protein n=1 Tax=Bradyrhizobium sp. TaxID=376 RepID=UPI0039E3A220